VSRSPVCKTCNQDPINRLTETLKAVDEGTAESGARDEMIDSVLSESDTVQEILDKLGAKIPDHAPPSSRPRIPIRAE
jgi:hypothetical protein